MSVVYLQKEECAWISGRGVDMAENGRITIFLSFSNKILRFFLPTPSPSPPSPAPVLAGQMVAYPVAVFSQTLCDYVLLCDSNLANDM